MKQTTPRSLRVRRPEGQGLNDPYVRFFCMAERRIRKDRGVVCFITNYSWLDGLSFTGMRERFLDVFDSIRIDCLNGDKYETGKVAPDGSPDPSIFSTEGNRAGIQVGTAIATLVRKDDHRAAKTVGFRHLWGQAKREKLTATAEAEPENLYENVEPILPLGLPFARIEVSEDWFDWPSLPDLFSTSFPGVKTSRDGFLVDTDLDRLKVRIADYFDESAGHDEIARRYPDVMKTTAGFKAHAVRNALLERGGPIDTSFVRYAYRPFDIRWLYWEADSGLLDRPRADYKPHVFEGNLWLVAQKKPRREWSVPQVISQIGCLDLMDRGATCIPAYLRGDKEISHRPNLTDIAQHYLQRIGVSVESLFHHVLATLHNPAYREANAGALRMEWPRIPLPGWPDGEADTNSAAELLAASAARGRELAQLLDPETSVPGVTQGKLRPEIAALAVPSTADGHNMTGNDFALTTGWGHFGQGRAVMPGRGRIIERPYMPEERTALGDALPTLGETTFDVYLNDHAYWRNVPAAVWNYKLGGYQVLKKWLSYRERHVLGRVLSPEEVQYFAEMVRRIGKIFQITASRKSNAAS